MIHDYESCEKCGAVVDIEILKELEGKREKEDNTSYGDYKYFCDFYDFHKWVCPVCKHHNQR